ncbi:MAG: hypothetical protein AMJ93_10440 [Anaerolineae bacterium SM23_84]|nr:MAG: hypothetical protein AMJ93_10440 [Anaerolineae bacterium SM23_84]
MKNGWLILGLLLTVTAFILSGCRAATPSGETPTMPAGTATPVSEQPGSFATEVEAEAPAEALAARDAALSLVSERYSEQAPPSDLVWTETRITPEGLIGAETYQYSAQDWVLTLSYPLAAPEAMVYQVMLSNEATGFQWEGKVDADGVVTEVAGVPADPLLIARDAALTYLREEHGEVIPAADLTWTRRRTTAEGLLGSESYEYRSGHWVITISYPVVAPEMVVYNVVVSNQNTGLQWEGEIDANGEVTEVRAPISGQPVVGWYGRVLSVPEGAQFDDYLALQPEGTGQVGLTGVDSAVEAEIEALRDSGKYANFWGTLAPDAPDFTGYQLVVTRLRVDEPGATSEPDPIEAWEGTIFSTPENAQYDDYFVLAGDFPVRYGLDSSDPALVSQLQGLRDTDSIVRLWGRLTCGVPDVNAAQIGVIAVAVVSQPTVPSPTSTSVDGWLGTIVALGAGAEYDDYFARDDGARYGIDAADEDLQNRIATLRTVGSRVRIWGTLVLDVSDVEGRQIQLERYELESKSEPVVAWVGTIVQFEPGAQYDDYFEREDGQRYGIETPDPKLTKRLEMLRDEGARVKIWGELVSDVPDVEGRQIRVTEIEVVE